MKLKSIFELERRVDLYEDYESFYKAIQNRKMVATAAMSSTIDRYLDLQFQSWPYREGCNSIIDYFHRKEIKRDTQFEDPTDTDLLYALELYYNLMKWAIDTDPGPTLGWDPNYCYVSQDLQAYIENLEYTLEACNYKVREITGDKAPQYVFTKRDCIVDSVVVSHPKLAECLLGYLDLRNEKDVDYKRKALITLAGYLEPKIKRNEFKGTDCSSICEAAKFAFNKLSIRHNNDNQIKLTKAKQIKAYDDVFYMCLFLLQYKDAMKKRDLINKYKMT